MTSHWWVEEVRESKGCTMSDDGRLVLCGWHENVVAAVRAVARMTAKERKQ